MGTSRSPVLQALLNHELSAVCVDFDHYRTTGGLTVETDYIIHVSPSETNQRKETFVEYKISKTFSSFRTFAHHLQKIADSFTKTKEGTWDSLSASARRAVKLSESANRLVDSQKTEYLGKVNFGYVKSMANQRRQIINEILDLTMTQVPNSVDKKDQCVIALMSAIESFFLTDFCEDANEPKETTLLKIPFVTPMKCKYKESMAPRVVAGGKKQGEIVPSFLSLRSPVVPHSTKSRRCIDTRKIDVELLKKVGTEATLVMNDGNQHSAAKPNGVLELSPFSYFIIAVGIIAVLRVASQKQMTIDVDIFILIGVGCFSLGFHAPTPQSTVIEPTPTHRRHSTLKFQGIPVVDQRSSARTLLKKSISKRTFVSPRASFSADSIERFDFVTEHVQAEIEEGFEDPLIRSPLPVFPEGAKLGSEHNCWSQPQSENYQVRGPKYLFDSKKTPSGPFVFPCRGVDLFLTDLCPENIGRNSGVMGGHLRDEPTFIVNFRLPWGVLVFYFSIPERLLPFLYKRYDPAFDTSKLPSLGSLTPGDRTVARFLMGDDAHKNATLKIVPVVVKGPWIVKSVVGGKPAIIGKALPVTYAYQPPGGKKACYLEAGLDIVASAAARGILSVARSATTELTIDLGFVVQGNQEDELPEQMLVGARLHGLDPPNAQNLPPMKSMFESDDGGD